MSSIKRREDGKWRARYRDDSGREHARHFDRKVDAQRWLDEAAASLVRGDHVDPKLARTTVAEWSSIWLDGYGTRRASTIRQAEVHLKLINAEFGAMRLSAVRPSDVRSWTTKLSAEGRATSYVYALHRRLSQLMSDAVHDGLLTKSPCSRRTSPPAAAQRPFVATTEQVWALHDAVPVGVRPAILLGAFAGLRLAEAAVLRAKDVDFMRGIISPAIQWPDVPLKTETALTPVPIPHELALLISTPLAAGSPTLVVNEWGQPGTPWIIERAVRAARESLPGFPADFRFHDLRHYFASLLIASGLDVKVVQTRLRHASAKTTLDTYGHLWPDSDESSRAAVAAVLTARTPIFADFVRTRAQFE